MTKFIPAFAIVCLFVGQAQPARAQARRPNLTTLSAQLDSPDSDQIRQAIEALSVTPSAQAVELLTKRIETGLSPDLLAAAMDALLAINHASAGPVLYELATHRRADVRLKAVDIIVHIRPTGAERALVTSLSDSSPRVRGAAAMGLGQLKAKSAMESLFLSLDRGTFEAAHAIALMAGPSEIDRLLNYIGHVPFDTMTPALDELLARRDVADRKKLDVIAKLQEIATPEARDFLQRFIESLSPNNHTPVRRAAEDAVTRISG